MNGRDVTGTRSWRRMLRAPWIVAGAVATVLLGSSASVASALDQANAAPGHTVAGGGTPAPPPRGARPVGQP
ncbi:hypothetical protein, partial [Streptomyces sp. NEAU-S77]|uniref:hypothetical protein n=1 Tax=Streptomyces sp. NEAU-S77 TaxID=3411033 RepID=UPI003BA168C8